MQCSNCQTENPDINKFCRECGTKLALVCPQCQSGILPNDRFCGQCGNNLVVTTPSARYPETGKVKEAQISSEPRYIIEGERRQATIVFSDLSGYTSMNERLDPEEVEAIMSRIKKEAVRIVERHEGVVNQFVGDEVLALFGIPVAHEDDPIRAVRATIEIHDLVRQINPEVEERIGTKLRMHTGISTGLVVTHIRDIRDGRYGITGDTVNTGARLAARAGADEILIGPETHNLIAPFFKTRTLESITVRGKTKSLTPYLVVGESAVKTRFEAAEIQGFTAFTGREHELTTLYACLDKTLAGKGQFVTVTGEAGLGKSRLVYEFRHSLNRSEITVLQGRCQSYGKSIPYFPHINALKRGLQLRDETNPVESHDKVVTNVLAIHPSLEKYLPVYLHLLSIPSEVYPLPQHLHGPELKGAIQEALAAIFILNATKQPMVLVFEDWHWVDEASDSALKHIIGLIASHPLMILAIFRPDYSASWGNWSHHAPIILNNLDYPNSENIIKSIWSVEHLPEGIVPVVHELTGGNPFFIEEISNELLEGGTVKVSNGQAILKRSPENLSLPNTVQAVIRARLDRLDRLGRESLRLASVIGREFAKRILEQISESTENLAESLETLKNLELIQQIRVVPEAEYMFKHVITQEVTYETLLKQKRKELHCLVGQAIEKIHTGRQEEYYEMLAYHYLRGEDWPRAFQYNREAGHKAQTFSAYVEALNFLEAALNALKKLPRTRTHLEQEIDLRHNMRSALFPLGRHEEWADHVRIAELLAKEINDNVRLARSYNFFSSYNFIRSRQKEAIKLGEEGLRLAVSSGDFSVTMAAKFFLGIPLFYTGNYARQVQLHREVAEQLSGPTALDRHGLTSLPSVSARCFLTWGLSEIGEFAEAESWSREGINLADQVKNVFSTVFINVCSGIVYLRQGNSDKALTFIKKAHDLSIESNLQSFYSLVGGSLGSVYLILNRPDEALPVLEESVKPDNLHSSLVSSIYPLTALSEAYRIKGQFEKAIETAEEALRIYHQTAEHCFGSWALYTMAKIQTNADLGKSGLARQTFLQAIELAAELNMQPLLAHCRLGLGRLHIASGNIDQALTEVKTAVELFRSLNMTFWLPEAEAILRDLS